VSKFENINKLTIVIYNSPQVYLKYIDYLLLLSYSEVLLRIFTVFSHSLVWLYLNRRRKLSL